MGAGHAGALGGVLVDGNSPVHRLAPHPKVLAVLGFAVVVVATPIDAPWAWGAYAGYLVLVCTCAAVAGVPARRLARGLVIEVPFVAFALLLPVVSGGPRVDVAGLSLSQSGLVAAGGLLAKATLAVLAATVLASTTAPRELVRGLERLRMPGLLVQILTFMVRYADVVAGELRRMRIARESRGFRGSRLAALRVLGPAAGSLFVRTFERGERVHLAMLSRGYTGRMPTGPAAAVPAGSWATALSLPAAAGAVLTCGLLLG